MSGESSDETMRNLTASKEAQQRQNASTHSADLDECEEIDVEALDDDSSGDQSLLRKENEKTQEPKSELQSKPTEEKVAEKVKQLEDKLKEKEDEMKLLYLDLDRERQNVVKSDGKLKSMVECVKSVIDVITQETEKLKSKSNELVNPSVTEQLLVNCEKRRYPGNKSDANDSSTSENFPGVAISLQENEREELLEQNLRQGLDDFITLIERRETKHTDCINLLRRFTLPYLEKYNKEKRLSINNVLVQPITTSSRTGTGANILGESSLQSLGNITGVPKIVPENSQGQQQQQGASPGQQLQPGTSPGQQLQPGTSNQPSTLDIEEEDDDIMVIESDGTLSKP